MTLENELLSIERTLWAAEAEAYRRNLDDRCLVAFTQMAGVSSREEIAGSVEGSQRWHDLDLEVVGLLQPTPDAALLTYRASGNRGTRATGRWSAAATRAATTAGRWSSTSRRR